MDLKEKLSDLLIDEYQIDVVKDEWKYQKIVNSIDIMIEMTQEIMKEEKASSAKGVMHCFTETYEMAKQAIDFQNLLRLLY